MEDAVKEMINNNKVMVFSKDYCPFCHKTKDLLKSKNVEFKAVEMDLIEGGNEMHAALKSISGQNTVPCIYINGNKVGGNDDLHKANEDGKLDEMLAT